MQNLIAKLEAAPAGSRELDADIALAVLHQAGYADAYIAGEGIVIQVMPGITASDLPHHTTSLDAGLPGEDIDLAMRDKGVWHTHHVGGYWAHHKFEAMARRIAALKAWRAEG